MNNTKHGRYFWIANALLALAFACLFFMGALSAYLGGWAMVLWMALAAAGFYLLTTDKAGSTKLPD
jgi:fatty acid desaturase